MRRVLLALPAVVVLAAAGVWTWQTFRPKPTATPEPPPEVRSQVVGGITFEVETRPSANEFSAVWGPEDGGFRRGDDWLDYDAGVLTVNGVGFPPIKPGDVVRWNLTGPLRVNGEPVQPHPLQPRQLNPLHTDLRFEPRLTRGDFRSTLTADWSRAGRVLVTATGDGVVRVWNPDAGTITASLPHPPTREIAAGAWGLIAAVAPNGKTVATAHRNGDTLILWDAAAGTPEMLLAGPAGNVAGFAFLTDDWLLECRDGAAFARHLAGSRTRTVLLGKVNTEAFNRHHAVAADGKTLALDDGANVTMYRIAAGPDTITTTATATIPSPGSSGVIALSADGNTLATFDGHMKLALRDAATGAVIRRLRVRDAVAVQSEAMAFSADGKSLLLGTTNTIRLYDVETGRERGWFPTPWVRSLAFSPDGKTLAAGLRYGPGVRVWDAANLR